MEKLVNFVSIVFFYACLHVVYNMEKCESNDNCCLLWDGISTECKVCSPGYLGQNCTQTCPYPNYGLECQRECNCDERLCDIATGCVSVSDGCRAGYYGDRCIYRCRIPNYGKHCQHICQCDESDCHYITGCPVHVIEATTIFVRETYMYTNSSISIEEAKEIPMMVLLLSITLTSVVTISLVVILVLCRRMKSTHDTCPSVDYQSRARDYFDTRDVAWSSQQYSSPCDDPAEPVQFSSMELRKSSVSSMYSPSANYYESVEFCSHGNNVEYSETREGPNDKDSIDDVKTEDSSSYVEMKI